MYVFVSLYIDVYGIDMSNLRKDLSCFFFDMYLIVLIIPSQCFVRLRLDWVR